MLRPIDTSVPPMGASYPIQPSKNSLNTSDSVNISTTRAPVCVRTCSARAGPTGHYSPISRVSTKRTKSICVDTCTANNPFRHDTSVCLTWSATRLRSGSSVHTLGVSIGVVADISLRHTTSAFTTRSETTGAMSAERTTSLRAL
jgi:hypothetical protein